MRKASHTQCSTAYPIWGIVLLFCLVQKRTPNAGRPRKGRPIFAMKNRGNMKRVLLAGAVLALGINSAAAETETEIRAKISRLEAEITILKAQLPKPKKSPVNLAL